MKEGFCEGWGRHLVGTFGIIFTVAGTLIALVLAKEYWWISVLVVVSAFVGSGIFSYRKHRDLLTAENTYRTGLQCSLASREEISKQLEASNQKLLEMPYEILVALQTIIAAHSGGHLAKTLLNHAAFVKRMAQFVKASPKFPIVRAFAKQDTELFVIAKGNVNAVECLRVGDRFLLLKHSQSGLETACACLVIHQPPDLDKGVIFYRVVDYLSDEMGYLENLAQTGNVEGIKGYNLELAYDVADYGEFDLQELIRLVNRLVRDITEERTV